MKSSIKKSIIYLLIASFMVNPLFSLVDFSKVKAADPFADDNVGETDTGNFLVSIPNQSAVAYSGSVVYGSTCPDYKRPSDSAAYAELTALMQKYNSSESLLTISDIFSAPKDAPIILTVTDRNAIKSLYCASKIAPKYEEDLASLYADSTSHAKDAIKKAVADEKTASSPRYDDAVSYLQYLKLGYGINGQIADAETKIKNAALFADLVKTAKKRIDNAKIQRIWGKIAEKIRNMNIDDPLPVDIGTLACVLREVTNDVRGDLSSQTGRERIANKIDGKDDLKLGILDSPKQGILNRGLIDIRVIKTLLYLVTPKNEGGAGHWRIRVKRILQDNNESNESNSTLDTLNSSNSSSTTSNATCEDGMTAAECGSLQNDQPEIEVTEKNGDEYEGWLNDLANQEDQTLIEKNISAHYNGQAIDVSEVDDIRCTLVQKRRIYIGGSGKDKKKQPIRPIKLAWQTTDGWDKSGDSSDFDTMSLMRNAASDLVSQMLTTLNGNDALDYEGDLSRASLEDMIMILGKSLVGYAVGTSNYLLQGYDLKETLQNLGGVYLADYLGLPREVFAGLGFNDIDSINYNIGRIAIEKRLGLPYGSLNSLNVLDSKKLAQDDAKVNPDDPNSVLKNNREVYNLEGTLINTGRRKIEYEMGLDDGDLLDLVHDGEIGGESLNYLVGRRVIENELNLQKDSWPIAATSYRDLGQHISSIRTEMIKLSPGYIDSLLHLPAGTTASFIRGDTNMADSTDFARKVGEIRLADTTAGLKYFAMSNTLYQLPGPDKDHPDATDTWAEALKGNKNALITVGVYTLARVLLGDNRNQIAPKLGDKEQLTKISVNEDGIPDKEIKVDQFTLYAVREWLRQGMTRPKDDACQKANPAADINVRIDENGRPIYTNDLSLPESVENQSSRLCVLYNAISYNIAYKDKDNNAKTAARTETLTISGEDSQANIRLATMSIGLEDLDLYRIFGYDKADGRSAYQTIGAKLLYYGLANMALGKEQRAKIDLLEVNPQLVLKSSDITFYVSRILRVVELTKQISDEWDIVQRDLPDTSEISDKINRIKADLEKIYSASDTDIDKYQKITGAISEILLILDDLKQNLTALQQYYATRSTPELRQKINQLNKLIIDVNELIKTASEIIAGKEILTADTLTLEQIKAGTSKAANLTDSGNGRRTTTKLSPLVLAGLIFGVLAGKIKPADMLVEVGAGMAEASLSLPANSLFYLLKNYKERGIEGKEAFFQAIGQARIEEQFKMPRYYFQGETILEPDFEGDYRVLKKWLPDDKYPNAKNLTDEDFQEYLFRITNRVDPLSPGYLNAGIFQTLIKDARENFWKEQRRLYGRTKILESTMDDIVKNIKQRKLNEASRSPENDLLFRLGFPMGQYSALVESSGNSGAWVTAATRARAIDGVFDIPENSTKSAFTGQKDLASSSLSNKEKNLLEASSFGVSKSMLEKYVQILNHELLPSEADQYGSGMSPDYIFNNPYAEQAAASENNCAILYTPSADQKFMINEATLGNNSFCYYDLKGRHCFESWEEAQLYANDHLDDKITDTLGFIAARLTGLYNSAPQFTSDLAVEDMISGLTDFVNDRSKISIFNDNAIRVIKGDAVALGQPGGMPDAYYIEFALGLIAASAGNDILKETFINLFTRKNLDAPVVAYKEIIGKKEAGKILTYRLFDGLNLDISPDLFDAGDFYDILNGDYSSLFRLGTSFLDRSLELPSGSTLLIYTALTPENLKCALDQIGGTFLGGLVGLNYVPIFGHDIFDLVGNIGQAKIEETLGLPRGTFRGDTIEQLIDSVRPINFTLTFKIPIDGFLGQSELEAPLLGIMGADQYARIKNSSTFYQLQAAKQYLDGAPVLSKKAYAALTELDGILREVDLYILLMLTDTYLTDILQMPGDDDMKFYQIYHKELNDFYNRMLFMDGVFGLTRGDTYLLLTNRMTPHEYRAKVGEKIVETIGLRLIATQYFGLEDSAADAAVDLVKNLKNIFACQSSIVAGVCGKYVGGAMSAGGAVWQDDEYYHDWGRLYKKLNLIFGFKLDDKLNLPDGTVQKVLDDPANALPVLMKIAAQSLDSSLKLDSNKVFSVTGLTEYLLPGDPTIQDITKQCHIDTYSPYGPSYDTELSFQIVGAKDDLKKCQGSGGDCTEFEQKLNALNQRQSGLDTTEQDCIRQKRADKANAQTTSDFDELCDESETWIGTCEAATYPITYSGRLWLWAQDVIIEKIHDTVANIKIKTGENCHMNALTGKLVCDPIETNVGFDMPLKDIAAFVKHGEMKYFRVAVASLAINIAMVKIDQWLTCPDDEKYGDECRMPLPAEFRITYDDLKFAMIGPDPNTFDDVAVYMAENGLSTNDFDSGNLSHGLSPADTGGEFVESTVNGAPTPDLTATEEFRRDYQEGYGMPADYVSADKVDAWRTATNEAQSWCSLNSQETPGFTYCVNERSGGAAEKLDRYEKNKADIVTQTKKRASTGLQYKMADAALWMLDPNVFPGFSEILVSGTSQQRWAALAKYISNGLKNNQLFGIHFDLGSAGPYVELAGEITVLIYERYVQKNPEALANFIKNGGYEALTDFIVSHSEDWFGFPITTDLAKGLVTGLASGDWGIQGMLDLDSVMGGTNTHTVKVDGKDMEVPTLGGALVDYGVSRIFAWADRHLQLESGTTYKVIKAGYNVYKTWKAYKAAVAAWRASGGVIGPSATGQPNDWSKMTEAGQAFQAAKGLLLQYIIEILVSKLLGKQIGEVESSLGLVPGSLNSLVSLAVYNFVAPYFGLGSVSAAMWQVAILIFILQNLFGVYKVEYWCTADGYYPKIGSPDYNYDISGLGIWGGDTSKTDRLNKIMKAKMIASAQYKAKRLIGDMLMMQYSTKYRDSNNDPIIPMQIMTGRGEDAKYWNNLVTTNLCQMIIGEGSYSIYEDGRSICEGDTRDGVWENLQTVAWTHIGF